MFQRNNRIVTLVACNDTLQALHKALRSLVGRVSQSVSEGSIWLLQLRRVMALSLAINAPIAARSYVCRELIFLVFLNPFHIHTRGCKPNLTWMY
jgi:hypothetical protein